jgi:hypothetical protein
VLIFAVGFGCVASVVAAQEAEGPVAVVSAHTTGALPDKARIAVEPRDDNDLNVRLGEVIAKALVDLGYTVDPNAPLRFTFDTDVQNNLPDDSRFRLEARGGQRSDIEWQLTWRVPNAAESTKKRGTAPLYGVEVIIDRPGELPLWRGKAVTKTRTSDTYHASRALARILIARLGREVDNEAVPLRQDR